MSAPRLQGSAAGAAGFKHHTQLPWQDVPAAAASFAILPAASQASGCFASSFPLSGGGGGGTFRSAASAAASSAGAVAATSAAAGMLAQEQDLTSHGGSRVRRTPVELIWPACPTKGPYLGTCDPPETWPRPARAGRRARTPRAGGTDGTPRRKSPRPRSLTLRAQTCARRGGPGGPVGRPF